MGGRQDALKALIAKFRTVGAERLARLNNGLLALQADPGDTETATGLLREVHTIKGEARMLGFLELNEAAHRTEDLLLHAKELGFRLSPDLTDLILAGYDLMAALLGDEGAAPYEQRLKDFVGSAETYLAGGGEAEIAEVDPALCVACGICVGSCVFDAIELKGATLPGDADDDYPNTARRLTPSSINTITFFRQWKP